LRNIIKITPVVTLNNTSAIARRFPLRFEVSDQITAVIVVQIFAPMMRARAFS